MIIFRIGLAALLIAPCLPLSALAVCAVDDANFTTADGGCKDVNTGIVWSSDLLGLPGVLQYPTSSNGSQQACDAFEALPEAGGYADWRTPTVGEVQNALANGLNSHLDFYYAAGNQPVDSEHRWSRCPAPTIKGAKPKYVIRYIDGDFKSGAFESLQVICVRGAAADDRNDCPSPGKKNNRSGVASAMSQTATGALLLLPLAVVLAARCLRPRRQ